MKKKLLKIFAFIFCAGLFLTGCATVSNVQDAMGNKISFDAPVYYQGQVAKVGDYVYYGNAYTDISGEEFKYTKARKSSYLARVDLSSLSYDEEVLKENYNHTSPLGVEKVNGKKLAGYVNQEMFAYGDYLYFTSANVHKSSSMQNDYSMVSLFRVRFNGDGLKEIGTFTNDENSSITIQEGSDGKYYFVIVCPVEKTEEDETTTYDVYSIKVGNSIGSTTKIASGVNSVVVADESSSLKNIVCTYGTDSERLPNAVKAVDYATGDETVYDGGNSETIALCGRVGDVVMYSYNSEVYYKDLTIGGTFSPSQTQLFYSAESISNVEKMGEGYMFVGATALMYKSSLSATATKLTETSSYKHILFVDGDYVYLSNDNAIMKISCFGGEIETVVSDMTIISGECGYADGYIYFYATLGDIVDEDGNVVERESEDTNYYMYRTDKLGNVQLLGKTK